jgi:hypothetical protein
MTRTIDRLPFTVAPASTPEQLRQALRLRLKAYGRHDYKASVETLMSTPDAMDWDGLSTTLVAISKQDRAVLGTVRLTSSTDRDIDWPDETPDDPCRQGAYTYIDRMAAESGEQSTLVACALIKAAYLWALSRDSEWATAFTLPPLARAFGHRGGMQVRGGNKPIRLPEYHDVEFKLIGVRLADVRPRLAASNPGYSVDFFDKVHPDICVHGVTLPWSEAVNSRPAQVAILHPSRMVA